MATVQVCFVKARKRVNVIWAHIPHLIFNISNSIKAAVDDMFAAAAAASAEVAKTQIKSPTNPINVPSSTFLQVPAEVPDQLASLAPVIEEEPPVIEEEPPVIEEEPPAAASSVSGEVEQLGGAQVLFYI